MPAAFRKLKVAAVVEPGKDPKRAENYCPILKAIIPPEQAGF